MIVEEHDELSSVDYSAILRDADGVPIPRVSVLDLSLINLYDGEVCADEALVILDTRSTPQALITGGVVQAAIRDLYCSYGELDGALRVHFPPTCTTFRIVTRRTELHVATFRLVHTTDTRYWEVGVRVRNLQGVS